MSTELLIKEIARHVLGHGYLHLGQMTLLELISTDLDVSEDELKRVEQYLNKEETQTNWEKANEAFYKWEALEYGDDSELSDDDRMVWIEGYLQALRDAE